jgi:hypothetical protein
MRYRLPETPDERSNARVLVLNHGVLGVINVGPEFRETLGFSETCSRLTPPDGQFTETRLCRHLSGKPVIRQLARAKPT